MKPQLLSGARGEIKFWYTDATGSKVDQTLAFVTDVSISSSHNLRPIYVIGDINPRNIEPLSYDASASIGRIIPLNAADTGAPLAKATAVDYNIEVVLQQILSSETVEIHIYDKNPADPTQPKLVGALKEARFAGKSIASSATDLGSERYNFVGIWDTSYNNLDSATALNYGMGSDSSTT